MKFWKDGASYPFKSHDRWFLTENIRWGKFAPDTDIKALVDQVNREDIWRDAAKDLGVAAADIPASSSRGKETFFDGKVFDPENPSAYLESLSIKALVLKRRNPGALGSRRPGSPVRINSDDTPSQRTKIRSPAAV